METLLYPILEFFSHLDICFFSNFVGTFKFSFVFPFVNNETWDFKQSSSVIILMSEEILRTIMNDA